MALLMPLDNPVISGEFGNSPEFYAQYGQKGHNGIDFACGLGTPVYAAADGWIVAEGWGQYDNWMGAIAGLFVRVGHAFGFTAYAHLSVTIVDVGQWVNVGQLIGYSGATGVGTGPHLHFEYFPLFPDFGNGFAGRVNPWVVGLEYRSSSPIIPPIPKPQEAPEMFIQFTNWRDGVKIPDQVILPGERRRLTYVEKGDSELQGAFVSGPADVTAFAVQLEMKGRAGDAVTFTLIRETGNGGKNQRVVARDRGGVFDKNGNYSRQLVFAGALSKGQVVRAYVQTGAGSARATVTAFYGSGYRKAK